MKKENTPIIIQQNAQTPHPVEHVGVGHRLARLEEILAGAPLEVTSGKSPFSRELEASRVDYEVKSTGLESFDVTTDPNDHLSYYENLMICHRYKDIMKCRLFISTFKAYARMWFSGLPRKSFN